MSKDIFFVFIVYSANLFADVNYKNKRTPQRGFLLFYYARSPAGATGKTTTRSSIQQFHYTNLASYISTTICRQKGLDATLGNKNPTMDSTKSYSHCRIFLLAAAGMPLFTANTRIGLMLHKHCRYHLYPRRS